MSDAQSRCGGTGFSGGGVALVQYPSSGFDADYRCVAQPALAFATSLQTVTAGAASGPMTLKLSQPASAAVTISVTSSSTAASFSTSTTGPWSPSLSLTIDLGTVSSGSFYYEDTRAGSPTLTASASGYTSATQTETVDAAALAAITVSPAAAKVRVGAGQVFSAAGSDRYGNPVAVVPSWTVSPALGTFSPNPGNPTTFSAGTVGTGTITAGAGGISGTASISVMAKKRHAGAARAESPAATRGAAAVHARLYVRPTAVAPGGRIHVFGNVGRCARSDTVFVLLARPRGPQLRRLRCDHCARARARRLLRLRPPAGECEAPPIHPQRPLRRSQARRRRPSTRHLILPVARRGLARRGGVLPLYNSEGFSLALGPTDEPIRLRTFLHFGIDLPSAESVRFCLSVCLSLRAGGEPRIDADHRRLLE